MLCMFSYTKAAMERAMKVQEVILRAVAKKITWYQAAEILALDDRLDDAARNLSECVAEYPNDLLPRYYYAILLSVQAQRKDAVQLQGCKKNCCGPGKNFGQGRGRERISSTSMSRFDQFCG
jgi:hypothetical protein